MTVQVAMVANKLNIPGVAKTRPSLSIPGKLIFPRLVVHDYSVIVSLSVCMFVCLLCESLIKQGHV